MDFFNDLPTLIGTVLTAFFGVWGAAKIFFGKLWKVIDEAEDVITESANLMKEVADVPAAFVKLAEVQDNGTVIFKPENWKKVETEVAELKTKIVTWKIELQEAITAIKNLFKKSNK